MARTTKKILAASLKQLLSRKALENITVTELVEVANVNRQTFYYNFKDIYDLVEWVFREEGKAAIGENRDYAHWHQGFQDFFQYLQTNRTIVMNAFKSYSRPALERYIKMNISSIVDELVRSRIKAGTLAEQDVQFIIRAYVLVFTGLTMEWMDCGNDYDYGADMNRFMLLMDGSIDAIAAKFSGKHKKARLG